MAQRFAAIDLQRGWNREIWRDKRVGIGDSIISNYLYGMFLLIEDLYSLGLPHISGPL